MTATATLERPQATVTLERPQAAATLERPQAAAAGPIPAVRTPADCVAMRREAMRSLDEIVRAAVERRLTLGSRSAFALPTEMTAYDAVYAATPAVGGHWTAALRRPSLFGVLVESYTIVLLFDEAQRPVRFRVCGATEVESDDATAEASDRTLAEAARRGPRRGWAPAFVPGLSL